MKLHTAFCSSPLGNLQIQCSDEYITSVSFCDSAPQHDADTHELLTSCTAQLQAYFNGQRKEFTLPLNQNGTAFQKHVWELLIKIPFGKTISYQQMARQYGDVKSIRAIAAANGKNNIAIIVPCHRVIGTNGSLVGYAGGLWRKKWLINHEAKFCFGVQELSFLKCALNYYWHLRSTSVSPNCLNISVR